MGMTDATLSGLILTDAILGRKNQFAEIYE